MFAKLSQLITPQTISDPDQPQSYKKFYYDQSSFEYDFKELVSDILKMRDETKDTSGVLGDYVKAQGILENTNESL
jgi:hypothetical protein